MRRIKRRIKTEDNEVNEDKRLVNKGNKRMRGEDDRCHKRINQDKVD